MSQHLAYKLMLLVTFGVTKQIYVLTSRGISPCSQFLFYLSTFLRFLPLPQYSGGQWDFMELVALTSYFLKD